MSTSGDTMINAVKVIENTLNLYGNSSVLNTPGVLMIPPHSSWYPSGVLNTPGVLSVSTGSTEKPSLYSVLSFWCTGHPRVYCTSPGVLHRHYAR